jgi:hypothetical protein
VYPERTGQIEITIKKKKFDGVDRVSVKPSRYDKKCIDFFDTKKALMLQILKLDNLIQH